MCLFGGTDLHDVDLPAYTFVIFGICLCSGKLLFGFGIQRTVLLSVCSPGKVLFAFDTFDDRFVLFRLFRGQFCLMLSCV